MSSQIQHAAPADQQAADQPQPETLTIEEQLDAILPPLDRKGRPGAPTKQEKTYRSARAAIRAVLEHLTSTEQALAASQQTNLTLQQDMQTFAEIARSHEQRAHKLAADLDTMGIQLAAERETMNRFLLTATLLVRLTGIEAMDIRLVTNENGVPTLLFTLAGFAVTIKSFTITIEGNGRYGRRFHLVDGGAIHPTEAMAILTFMGITREPEEAYSQAVYSQIFMPATTTPAIEPKPEPDSDHDISLALARIPIGMLFQTRHETLRTIPHTVEQCPSRLSCPHHGPNPSID